MSDLIATLHVPFITVDAIEHGLRNVLTGKPHQMLRHITINSSAEHKASLTEGGERKYFSNEGTESELTLQAVVGMLDYRRNGESVAFEGTAFMPNWVAGLELTDFTIRAAFVGYTDPSHADAIITHARKNPYDWINTWLEKDRGDETAIRAWVASQAKKCIELKSEAEYCGYPFFDISAKSFEDYKLSVQNYFLQPKA
jgi:hypothetical protein